MARKFPGRSRQRSTRGLETTPEGFSLTVAAGGLGRSLVLDLLLVLLSSAAVYFTSLDERVLSWVVNFGSFLILGFASFLTARRTQSHGFIYGMVIGLSYAALTMLVGTLLFPPFPGLAVFWKRLLFSLVAGVCGGIFGVNS